MVIDGNILFSGLSLVIAIKAILVLLLVFNFVFSLIVFRQVQLMGKRLPTPLGPFLRFVSTVYIGLATALLLLVIGVF